MQGKITTGLIEQLPAHGIIRKHEDRAAWLEARQGRMTASKASALFGINEYLSLYRLWALESGLLTDDVVDNGNMRRGRRLGPARIAGILGMPASTVHRILARHQVARLAWLDRPTGRVIRSYEHEHPGDLLHMDVKKLGRMNNLIAIAEGGLKRLEDVLQAPVEVADGPAGGAGADLVAPEALVVGGVEVDPGFAGGGGGRRRDVQPLEELQHDGLARRGHRRRS